ncbi:MAG: hypothetical protein ACLQFR_31155 [Streptosporangiaceae bacterium]
MSPVDSPADLANRLDARRADSPSDFGERQRELAPGHPSSVRPADGHSNARDYRRLTDAEYADHVADVEDRLADARACGMASDVRHTIDDGREVWSDERDAAHHSIIEDL